MGFYYIGYNGKKSTDYNLLIDSCPEIVMPARSYEMEEIPGRDGSVIIDHENYKDGTIECEFQLLTDRDDWMEKFRECKRWLLGNGDKKLILSDSMGYFYAVKMATIDSINRELLHFGIFTVTFLVAPYEYVLGGEVPVTTKNFYNRYAVSHPTFCIKGEGVCSLTVNGKTMRANVGQNLTINTELQIAYREDGAYMNTAVTGDYKDLYLQEGQNKISITSGFELKTAPNWRI